MPPNSLQNAVLTGPKLSASECERSLDHEPTRCAGQARGFDQTLYGDMDVTVMSLPAAGAGGQRGHRDDEAGEIRAWAQEDRNLQH